MANCCCLALVVGPSDDSTPPGHYRGQSTARKAPVQKSVIPVVPAKFLAEASSKKQTKKKTKKQPAEETSARRREMVNPTNFSALLVVIHRFDSNFATAAGGTKLDTNGEVDEATTEADSEDDSEIDVSYAKSAIPTCYSATFGEVEQLDQTVAFAFVKPRDCFRETTIFLRFTDNKDPAAVKD
ncbi:hypothetical protein PPTG_23254 [Phytophthora nicotianae INRA-310]|uniref:Uncharacterized protein n=1 Tax=Phytophthora nicotianae (strain INRA-310) TaxID=761204 RepID=W2Q506_PHYN3|nr:hypothetical protein PPTG_23254 [Phytophthora nicotianae INRA-310]ETN07335.1 hypothetical protein PPTG_23254 [Phytophthora nicotianae INRA-310]